MNKLTRRGLVAALALGTALWQAPAFAAWPEKPIKLIWPYAAGGLGYNLTRVITDGLTERLGQPVVIDVKPGAGGTLGAAQLKLAPPDGYTLMMGTIAPLALAPGLYGASLPYDPVKDFEPIVMTYAGPNVVVVNAKSPIKSFADLVAYAKANPGKLAYGTAGNGSTFQLTAGLFSHLTRGEMVNVPFKGGSAAFMSLLAGDVDVVFGDASSLTHVEAGKLRALAVLSPERVSFAPDIPTTRELGMPEVMLESWYGIVAPAGTPKAIVDRINKETAAILATARVQELVRTMRTQTARETSSEHFRKTIASEVARWRPVIEQAGIKPN